jgi:mannose-6-phosphate isomerase-like protein (cupin superfamily)
MIVKSSEAQEEPSRHGSPKRVYLRGGALPDVTQVAVGTMETGFEAELHSHPTMYENYYVLEGRAVYRVGEEEREVGPGDLIVVPPATPHRQRVLEGPHRVFYWGIATGPSV